MDRRALAYSDVQSTPPAAVIALLGLPASGKSTIAAGLATSQPGDGSQERLSVHVASLDLQLARLSAAAGPSLGSGQTELPGAGGQQDSQQHFDPGLWKV
jgi:hypothetical protein